MKTQILNRRQGYLLVAGLIALLVSLLYVPRNIFEYDSEGNLTRVYSFVYGGPNPHPEIKDGFILDHRALWVEWAIIAIVFTVLIISATSAGKMRFRLLWAVFLIGGIAGSTWCLLYWDAARPYYGPLYSGKPLSFWLGATGSQSVRQRAKASEVLASVGPEAVPSLIEILKVKPPHRKTIYPTEYWTFRPEVFELLARLGPQAKEALPELLSIMKDDNASHWKDSIESTIKQIDPIAAAKLGIR